MEEHEDMDTEDQLDSSSSHVHDSSKEGEVDDQSSAKPKRNRKSTQRLLDSFMDDELTFAHKQKKKIKPAKKMDSFSDAGASHNESGDLHSEATSDHEPAVEESEKEKERRTRVVPGKAHVQCTFMESKKKLNSQCKQRAIEGYLFCIWHILNDKQAPYKRCAHLRDKNKNGVATQVQCKTAIRDIQEPPFCLAHSDKTKKAKKKKDSSPSASTRKGGSSETASPVVGGSVAPSSPSSSIFNLPNEEFAHDIDEAIGNMDAGNLMDTFDDFESLDDEEEWKEEEDTVASVGTVPPPGPAPLPFEMDEDMDEEERQVLEKVVVPIYQVGKKIIHRLATMRDKYLTGPESEFWSACGLHPDAPSTAEEYSHQLMTEARVERMDICQSWKEEIICLMRDPSSELFQELGLIHKYNTDLLREQLTMERSKINNVSC